MRILVVEDVPMVRERIVEALLELPDVFVVGEADRVETALSTIESSHPDVVLLDMSLPSASPITSGLGILKWIKQTHSAIQVVMLTNHAVQAYRDACVAEGAYAYLDKSYEFDKLPDVIAQLNDDLLAQQQKINARKSLSDQRKSHSRIDYQLDGRLDWLTHDSLRWVLGLYFLLAAIHYFQSNRNRGRKEQLWQHP